MEAEAPSPAAPPSATRFEWPAIDYAALDAAMAHADETIRRARSNLEALHARSAASV